MKFSRFCQSGILAIMVLNSVACFHQEEENNAPQLSGLISISGPVASAIDSDINDPAASYLSNDSIVEKQYVPVPSNIGGYVNVAGAGLSGRSKESGDTDDYYYAHLQVGQVISVKAEASVALQLQLIHADGSIVSATNLNGQLKVTAVAESDYYIHVQVISGAGSYVLSIEAINVHAANQSNLSSLSVNDNFVPGEIIVRFKPPAAQVQSTALMLSQKTADLGLNKLYGQPGDDLLVSIKDEQFKLQAFNALSISNPTIQLDPIKQAKQDTIDVVQALRQRDDVIEARPNYIRQAYLRPQDTKFVDQWNLLNIALPQAWDISTGSEQVVVAVIDTGVLVNHPDLKSRLVPGYDFIADDSNSADQEPGIDSNPDDVGDDPGFSSFHGTHIAGIIGASTNEPVGGAIGIAGVDWHAKIMPIRVLGRKGGTDYDIEQAILYAAGVTNAYGVKADKAVDVINLSLGGPTNSTVVPRAYEVAWEKNIIVVAAVGNSSEQQAIPHNSYPVVFAGVVGVGAVDVDNNRANYSNYGTFVDVTAPGGVFNNGIWSTGGSDNNTSAGISFGYFEKSGTSMAAAHISGIAALMKSVYPALTADEFDRWLRQGWLTQDLGEPLWDQLYGHGIINAAASVELAKQAAAGVINKPAAPAIEPNLIDLGNELTSQVIAVSNFGTSALTVTQVSTLGDTWLRVEPITSQINSDSTGNYLVTVDRAGLLDGQYSAKLIANTSAGDVSASVSMQVENLQSEAGRQYVYLKKYDSTGSEGELVAKVATTAKNGRYYYAFENITPGIYTIESSSDLNNSQTYCDNLFEICGTYKLANDLPLVTVTPDGSFKANLDFQLKYN